MRFEEAYSGWTERRLTQEEAARLLGVCARTFRRYIDRYDDEGLDGLLDKRLTQVSHRRAPVDEVLRLSGIVDQARKAGQSIWRFCARIYGRRPLHHLIQNNSSYPLNRAKCV